MTATSKNGSGSVRVLLASASAVRLAGLEALVKSAPSLKLVGTQLNPQAIFARAPESKADVVLVDLERESSLALTTKISSPVVLLIDNPDPNWTAQALRFGVRAILARDAKPDEILHAVKAADSGLVLLTAEVTRGLAEHVRAPLQKNDEPLEQLTTRELEVLAMLAEGLGNRQIADRLRVSDHTIKFHISSILDKLDASTRTEAVTVAVRMGLILL
jgi:two-component system, NarL family, response regulator YdfI